MARVWIFYSLFFNAGNIGLKYSCVQHSGLMYIIRVYTSKSLISVQHTLDLFHPFSPLPTLFPLWQPSSCSLYLFTSVLFLDSTHQ